MAVPSPRLPESRIDLLVIAEAVPQKARVLDVGCGDGALLRLLRETRGVEGRGIDVSRDNVKACLAAGLSAIQGDADEDLDTYPDAAFDVVVLSQTIQATRRPRRVLEEMLRIGRLAIISFPNFAHWQVRWQILAWGRMPVTPTIGYAWHESPNIHLCTIRDFAALADEAGAIVERRLPLDRNGRPFLVGAPLALVNIVAPQALFVLRRPHGSEAGAAGSGGP